jgi:hypothetical protein
MRDQEGYAEGGMETSTTELMGAPQVLQIKWLPILPLVALNDIYHTFLIFQSYISYVLNLFIQKEN